MVGECLCHGAYYEAIVKVTVFIVSTFCLASRLVNKCMSTHLNANVNVSFDSNANANAIFQERIEMQMFWGRIQMHSKCFGYTFANAFELI